MRDFVSQASFELGLEPPSDALGHDEFAVNLLEKLALLSPGAVVALHGDWGRGKTDVLSRIAVTTYGDHGLPSAFAPRAIWINPWQYGTPDLLSPVVIALLERVSVTTRLSKVALRKAAETVVKAGLSFGLKAVGLTVPGGKIYKAAAEEAKSLLEGLFTAVDIQEAKAPDPDPVAAMGQRFRELVDALLPDPVEQPDVRLLVLIDDLDRCAPERQVALLESIRFLVSAGAKATFVVALDPALTRQAVRANYQTDAFDADQYLEKIFSMRVYLPAISVDSALKLVDKMLNRTVPTRAGQTLGYVLEQIFDVPRKEFLAAVGGVIFPPDLRNPRLVSRLLEKLYLLATTRRSFPDFLKGHTSLQMFVIWLCLAERWPQFRAAMQSLHHPSGNTFEKRFEELLSYYAVQFQNRTVRGQVVGPDPEDSLRAKTMLAALGLPQLEPTNKLLPVLEMTQSLFQGGLDRFGEIDEFLLHSGL